MSAFTSQIHISRVGSSACRGFINPAFGVLRHAAAPGLPSQEKNLNNYDLWSNPCLYGEISSCMGLKRGTLCSSILRSLNVEPAVPNY